MNSETSNVHGDSLKKRFGFKLFTNFLGLLIGFVFAGLIPRILGPKLYGDYNFLTNFFTQLINFLELRSSTFLYTQISNSQERSKPLSLYLWITLLLSIFILAFTSFATLSNWQHVIWPGQTKWGILLASALCLLFWYSEILSKICDAIGITVVLEKARIISKLVFFVVLLLLFYFNLITFFSYFAYQLTTTLIVVIVISLLLFRSKLISNLNLHPTKMDASKSLKDIFNYSHPVFVYSFLGIIANYFDRWMLQKFAGSSEQGFYSFALNISLVFNIFINAIHPLILREFSIAFSNENKQKAADLFIKLVPTIYTLTAIISCFIIAFTSECVDFIGGSSFENAKKGFLIMSFLPIIHNYSILSGSVLWASNNTRIFRNISFVLTPLGILSTILLIGSNNFFGFNLGSLGLAYKTVGLEFIGVNTVLWFNCKLLNLKFFKLFFHQIYSVVILIGIAMSSKLIAAYSLSNSSTNILSHLIVGGIAYLFLVSLCFWFLPNLFGIKKQEILDLINKLKVYASKPKVVKK